MRSVDFREGAVLSSIGFASNAAASGFDPLTGAPTPITKEQRKEAGVDARPAGPAPAPNEPGHVVRPSEERS